MRRVLALLAVAAAALAAAATAGATNECNGLQVCVPVAGPWVSVPAQMTVPRPEVQFRLSCPKGYVAGGLDAELTDSQIELDFLGAIGAPINPGITTTGDVDFVASYVGTRPRAPLFRPHVGCMPARGGGGRVPTSAFTVVPPGHPVVRHVKTVLLAPIGVRRIAQGCAAGERLVGAASAVAFPTPTPPPAKIVGGVVARRSVVGSRVVVTAHAAAATGAYPVLVQVQAICAGGK